MKKLIIQGTMTTLNEHDNANRTNRYAGAKIKHEETQRVFYECRRCKLTAILKSVRLIFRWYSKDKRKDPDNICFAKKYILDGLVQAGILENDTQEFIKGFEDKFYIDAKNPRVEIEII